MSKKAGTKNKKTYHRKNAAGEVNNRRITCRHCGLRHYEARYHWCPYKPELLDLYCCAGAAGMGYYQAGFNITGVDIADRPNYPFRFIKADAIEYIMQHGREFDFIHASPPCQMFTPSTAMHRSKGKSYVDLVDATRMAIIAIGIPGVMENVLQAPLRADLVLRGEMFGLKVIRKRKFEFVNTTFPIVPPQFEPISVIKGQAVIVMGHACYQRTGSMKGNRVSIKPEWALPTVRQTWAYAMGITHYMRDVEISESIPPEYTRFIGENIKPFLL